MIVWDEGTYHASGAEGRAESQERMRQGLEAGKLQFILEGHKLRGEFTLIRIRGRGAENWLLLKKPDEFATDEDIRLAAAGVKCLYREWAALPSGGTLRATWPLHDSWLRLLLARVVIS